MVRDDALVGDPRPHTKNYSDEARELLGLAVIRAREAAGHAYRPSFAALADISVRSLLKLETGKPVGPLVYEAVARALPSWTEVTPRVILEGADPPVLDEHPELDTEPAEAPELDYSESSMGYPVGSDEWLEHYADIPEAVRAGLAVRKKRRELEQEIRRLAEQAAKIAESALPNDSGERS